MPDMTRPAFVVVAAAAALLQTAPAAAQRAQAPARAAATPTVDPLLFQGLNYRLVGPSRGGRVTAVTGVPSQRETFYMGVASGGVFRTTDGGKRWTPITDGQMPVASVGDIAVALSDPDVIYVGTGSDGLRSNVSTGRGVYKSVDGGTTWAFAGLYDVGQIGAVRIHPTDPNTVWVAANGDAFKPSRERGVFKTTDGGKSWRKVLYVSDSTGAMDVELMPGDPNTVFAWMSRIERKPWSIISGAREGGFYKSSNGGETWTRIRSGLPQELIGKGNLAVTAADPQRLYALIEAKPGGGLYRSDDAGASWQLMNSTAGLTQRPFYYTTLGADPTNADIVYAGAESFYKSVDGGRTVTVMRTPHTDNHDIWVSPSDGNVMVQANDGGANVSFDGGRTWSTQMNQVNSEWYGVWLDAAFPYNLYAAQQDNSTIIMSSLADPFDASSFRGGPGCETGPIIPHPRERHIVYGNCKGQFSWTNLETGQQKNYWIGGQSLYGNDARDLIWRFQRTTPMATSPHDPDVLYYGSQFLHRTRDKGITWETISPDLTANDPRFQGASGEPITRDVTGEEFYSTLYAISESPLEAGVIWTGANDGPFHVTRDNGKTWTDVTPKDLPWGGRVAWIDASPHRKGSAYYAVYRYLLGDYAPYLYKTDDYGQTWTRLTPGTNGIPADWPTRVVREDPEREGLLYAGTEFGMFISYDDGRRWQEFRLNMPHVPINDIRVHRGDLIVATQGRAMWILDNLSALRQFTPDAKASAFTVYTPRPGYRTRTGAALLGPQVDYRLPTAPSGPVIITIRDASGAVVNSYRSDARPPAPARARPSSDEDDDPAAGMVGGRATSLATAPVVSIPTTQVGLNRFTWDVQHQNGLGAPPGAYTATVSVDGQEQTVPLRVLIDPRLADEGLTEADLQEQFTHNARMQGMIAELRGLTQRLTAERQRLAQAEPQRRAAIEAVLARIQTEPVRYGKPGLQQQLSYLAGMTTRVDMKVGRDNLARANVLRAELDALLAAGEQALRARE
jgi:photosystem II stability/assembly factor-like uncharacterized protein